jgi:pyruvate/2-oxoacid:ferredoxin oxidoreductase beta subunit
MEVDSSKKLVRLMNHKNGYYSFIDVYSMCVEYDRIEPKHRIPKSYLLHETEFMVHWVGKGAFEGCEEDMHGCELENEYIMLFRPTEESESSEEEEEEEGGEE